MLELKNITKKYTAADSDILVLKGINLVFRDCEFVSILGPSGCGKTTMLNIIGGLDHYTSGDLLINGTTTKKYKDKDWDTYRNHTIGFVFQSYNLIPHSTVLKNVELALSLSGVSRAERKKRAIAVLEKVGLKEHLNKKPNQLSGGQCQRVSIARALINNPDIILADEPTGALDTETSITVMELLKEISKDRLVIMVTHNPELAQNYSTRIISMLDGVIQNDTNPLSEDEYAQLLDQHQNNTDKVKNSAMSLATSAALSGRNLLTKKRRTFITAFASSIGIIGVSVILSVSNGLNDYINNMETSSSASNYIAVGSSYDTSSLMSATSTNSSDSELEEYPTTDNVILYTKEEKKSAITQSSLSQEYLDYIQTNVQDQNLTLGIQYSRDLTMNIVTKNNGEYVISDDSDYSELLDNEEYMADQYTVLAGNKMPTEYNEVALVLDKYNRLSTQTVKALGITYSGESIPFSDIINKEFRLAENDVFYHKETYGEGYVFRKSTTQEELKECYDQGISLKVTAVIRPNENTSHSWVSSGIAYTSKLTDKILEVNLDSEVVKYQKEHQETDILTGQPFTTDSSNSISSIFGFSSASYQSNLISLGGESIPTSLTIYPKDFDAKDKILTVLDNWNNSEIYKVYGNEKDAEGNYVADNYKVSYTDVSQTMISMISGMIDIVATALVAFSSISLVVSTIMIAIITYASVIERTKEIGIIRAVGGRKKDISHIFMAEAGIIGTLSFVVSLLGTLGLNSLINVIINAAAGISTIAVLSPWTILVMALIGIGLNLIASILPARMAAKKDPVVCLRTE